MRTVSRPSGRRMYAATNRADGASMVSSAFVRVIVHRLGNRPQTLARAGSSSPSMRFSLEAMRFSSPHCSGNSPAMRFDRSTGRIKIKVTSGSCRQWCFCLTVLADNEYHKTRARVRRPGLDLEQDLGQGPRLCPPSPSKASQYYRRRNRRIWAGFVAAPLFI